MNYVSPVPRHRRATPSRCAVLGRRLKDNVRRFERRGVRIPHASRLVREARALAEVATARAFPADRRSRRIVANGIRDAYEFRAIAQLVSSSQVASLAEDLRSALKGTPEQGEAGRRPYQFQSQLWMGSIFLHGPVRPTVVPQGATPAPDFILDVEGRTYGLEVKRPGKRARLREQIKSARDQLAAQQMRGGVAIDVSDCISDQVRFSDASPPRFAPQLLIDQEFEALYKECGHVVFDEESRRHQPGFERVVFLIVYANGWRWTFGGPRGPELFTASQFGRFLTSKGNLPYWDADRIRDAYIHGLKATGMHFSRVD